MLREVVEIKLAGEVHSLPVTFAEANQLTRLGLCPYQRATEAGMAGKQLGLAYTDACAILAVGMQAAGQKVTQQELWAAGRGRKFGVKDTVEAALGYWMTFVSSVHQANPEPPVEGTDAPKA